MADPLYIPIGLSQAFVRWRLTGDPDEMVITFGIGQAGADQTAEEEADNVHDAAMAASSLIISAAGLFDQWTYVGVTVKKQTATGFEFGEHLANLAGTAAGENPPVNTAILVHKRTALGGRHNRGRFYLPPYSLDEADISDTGMLASGTLTSWSTKLTNFFDALVANDVVPTLFHYPFLDYTTDPPTVTDPTPDPTTITSFAVDPQVATQRKRMRR